MIGSTILSPGEQSQYLKSQEGTARLDNFVHCLLLKCNAEVGKENSMSRELPQFLSADDILMFMDNELILVALYRYTPIRNVFWCSF